MSEIYLKLINSEFGGEEAEKTEFASLMGLALDYIGRNEHLEGIYTCYVPFFAIRINEGNFAVSNAMSREKNKFSVSKIPELSEVKSILNSNKSMHEKYKEIENMLLKKNVETVEISGILGKKGISGLAKLITQHSSNQNSSYKKLSPIISREEVKAQIQTIQKYILSEMEVEERVDKFMEELEKAFQNEINELEKKRVDTEKEYDMKLKGKEAEIQQK
ncbi:MAG: hypothetical protein ACTSPI_10890, partial [Candidatus Heimdallarchaeaceae archaeon]